MTDKPLVSSTVASEEQLRQLNTSMQYISDNSHFLQDAFRDLARLLEKYTLFLQANNDGTVTDVLIREVEVTTHEVDIEYLTDEIPNAIQQTLEGVKLVSDNPLVSSASPSEERLRQLNTSMQYISANSRFLLDACKDLMRLLEKYTLLLQANKDGTVTDALIREVEMTARAIDVTHLTKESSTMMQQMLEGIESVTEVWSN
jgi:hypothetical protein